MSEQDQIHVRCAQFAICRLSANSDPRESGRTSTGFCSTKCWHYCPWRVCWECSTRGPLWFYRHFDCNPRCGNVVSSGYIYSILHILFYILGVRAQTKSHVRQKDADRLGGLRGLKSLGVRDLTYKMAFLACSIQPSNPAVLIYFCISEYL